jgi:hypothetical protein
MHFMPYQGRQAAYFHSSGTLHLFLMTAFCKSETGALLVNVERCSLPLQLPLNCFFCISHFSSSLTGSFFVPSHFDPSMALRFHLRSNILQQTRRMGKNREQGSSKASGPEWIPLHSKQAERSNASSEQGDGHVVSCRFLRVLVSSHFTYCQQKWPTQWRVFPDFRLGASLV